MLKICNICRTENSKNAEYCKVCGNRLTNNNVNNYSSNFNNGNSFDNNYDNGNGNFNNGNSFGNSYDGNGNFNNGNVFGNSYGNGNGNFNNGNVFGNSYGNGNSNFNNGNVFGNSYGNGYNNFVKEVPPECKQLNVSAFFLGFIWALANRINVGLLCLVPFLGIIMNFILLFKGNEWAWKNNNFSSVEEFQKKQKILSIITCVLYAVIFIGLGIFCICSYYYNYCGGYPMLPAPNYPMPHVPNHGTTPYF